MTMAYRLSRVLSAIQIVGVLTLLRSVAYERWITVLVSGLLILGARAALRDRAWGIALAFAAAVWFPAVALLGIAPPWFVFVGLLGAFPFALTWRSFARFDVGAARLLAVLAASFGLAGAWAWKEVAWSIFAAVPLLRPSFEAHEGLALGAASAIALGAVVTRSRGRHDRLATAANAAPMVRVGNVMTSGTTSSHTNASEDIDEADTSLEIQARFNAR
jgi:hypothetical protein